MNDKVYQWFGDIISAAGVGLLAGAIGGSLAGALMGGVAGLIFEFLGPLPVFGTKITLWAGWGAFYCVHVGARAGPISSVIGWLTRSRIAGALAGLLTGGALAGQIASNALRPNYPPIVQIIVLSGGAAAAGVCGIIAASVRTQGEE